MIRMNITFDYIGGLQEMWPIRAVSRGKVDRTLSGVTGTVKWEVDKSEHSTLLDTRLCNR
jgi:hypothetical protein